MRANGINYDTGFINLGVSTHEPFFPEIVQREMQIIRDDLHCTAVRITGGDPERLEVAAVHAAAVGLEIWFCPFTCDLNQNELLDLLADCAERAERLRRQGASVVLCTGSEVSLFTKGFLPGERLQERIDLLGNPERLRAHLQQVPARMNAFLAQALGVVRARFGGPISYASLPFEGVDWTPFDVIATDAGYRTGGMVDRFSAQIRAFVELGKRLNKPVAVTEFGCGTYQGAADQSAQTWEIVEYDGARPVRIKTDYDRDEQEQVVYLRELLDIFNVEGIDAAFVYTFARYDLPHRDNPNVDLDLASYGIVKVLDGRFGSTYPDMAWEPKPAFRALADYYRGSLARAIDDPQS